MIYDDYHQNPINKVIHAVCIPIIVVTTINLLSILQHKLFGADNNGLICLLMPIYYYYNYSGFVAAIMFLYYIIAITISDIWLLKTNYSFCKTIDVFILAWLFQFVGHYIEGSSPALLDGLSSALTEAPLFSLNYIFRII